MNKTTILKVALVAVLTLSAGTVTTEGDYTVEDLQDRFDEQFSDDYPDGIIVGITMPYSIEPFMAGLISMYEATQDPNYIKYAIKNFDSLFGQMVDIDNPPDGYDEWIGVNFCEWDIDCEPPLSDPTDPRSACLCDQRGARQFARLARVIKNDKYLDYVYGDEADYIIDTIKHHIINNPWCKKRFIAPHFHTVHHIISHPTLILLELYLIEGDQEYLESPVCYYSNCSSWNLPRYNYTYLETINDNADMLKNSLFDQGPADANIWWGATDCEDINDSYPDCYGFNHANYPCYDGCGEHDHCSPSDVSHAENFIFTAIALYRAGIVFVEGDITSFADTFRSKIWDGNSTDPCFYDFIDGKLEAPLEQGGQHGQWKMGGNIAPGWVGLGAFDTTLHGIVEAAEDEYVDNSDYWLNEMAYYAELARNLVAGDSNYTNNAKEVLNTVDDDCDGVTDEFCSIVFSVKNSSDEPIAWFDSVGNLALLQLAGTFVENTTPTATGNDEFRVQDSNGTDVAIIDTVSGNMDIKGSLHENQGSLTPSPGSDDFIIKNSSDQVVAYIDESGNLYLKGKLYDAEPLD